MGQSNTVGCQKNEQEAKLILFLTPQRFDLGGKQVPFSAVKVIGIRLMLLSVLKYVTSLLTLLSASGSCPHPLCHLLPVILIK